MGDRPMDARDQQGLASEEVEAFSLMITGRVQGVGYRPFVYRSAKKLGLSGWVRNETGQVVIHAEGTKATLSQFGDILINRAPPLARPQLCQMTPAAFQNCQGFDIKQSAEGENPQIHIPPDMFTCPDCLTELQDPTERRYLYPFINCTQCGPRYTIIEALPYDRPNTSLKGFPLCPSCHREYSNPDDRRFHAQPLACPDCGPQLEWVDGDNTILGQAGEALHACIAALKQGNIVAVKGVGGYHLMCDAANDDAVLRLRSRKQRPDKPLAVMFPMTGQDGLESVRGHVSLKAEEAQGLIDPMRPIILAEKSKTFALSLHLTKNLGELGVFLLYSPLHHLIMGHFNAPLVATSGNLSGEPVITDNKDAQSRLGGIADYFLHHNRPIVRPADDPVLRLIDKKMRPIRLGRGIAPLELELPKSLPYPILAVGGHMKNTIALAWDNRVVVSPHIGTLDSPRSMAMFEQVASDLQSLYGVTAQKLVCDKHPGYNSTRWAKSQDISVTTVQHHKAHASALAGEHPDVKNWLIFTWDGTGYGDDGSLWGGEAFWRQAGQWQRVASFRPFHLLGGDKAGREPWRSGAALRWEAGLGEGEGGDKAPDTALAKEAWQQRINTFQSSSVGRLFDGAASMVLGLDKVSFEGQGPMALEAAALEAMTSKIAMFGDSSVQSLPLTKDQDGLLRSDWSKILPMLMDESQPAAQRAADFHATMAQVIIDQIKAIKQEYPIEAIGLTGGVFQNRPLSELVINELASQNSAVYMPSLVPANDGGLSYGQVIEFLYQG